MIREGDGGRHRVLGPDESLVEGKRNCESDGAKKEQKNEREKTCSCKLYMESLILAQDERWRRA